MSANLDQSVSQNIRSRRSIVFQVAADALYVANFGRIRVRGLPRTKRGAVLYRVSNLLGWEEDRMRTASSDHDDPSRGGA